ncbi:MAG: energy-coupling factor transporter transmembrane protein EcfT [Alicyclobacillus sp.]|nr:energy-coupling factor transporter transmembrane protein EcfT [Alicyclobacillus sp.]
MAGDFELTRNITIGQYLPTGSVIHRMDPRLKLLAAALWILSISLCHTYLGNVAGLCVCLALFALARIPLSYGLSGLKPAIPFILILAILQLLFYGNGYGPSGQVYFHWGILRITSASVRVVVVSTLRFVEIIFAVSVLTLSTSITELTHGVEGLLRPLGRMKVPVHAFALIVTIAVRFVPTFAMEMEKMMKAQASRGAEFGTGSWWNIARRTRDVFPLIIPLFNTALVRAEELALAMEARGYVPGQARTAYRRYRAGGRDIVMFLAGMALSAALVFAPFPF